METIKLGKSDLMVPRIAIGCMRLDQLDEKDLADHIRWAVEHGMNFFDHADIYGAGECEKKFAKAFKLTGLKREDVILQSKCGIVPGKMYDFSKAYILASVDGILDRLETEYLDVLLLHRPDALMDPAEVAEAFSELMETGKVKHFGVSNFTPLQIQVLQSALEEPLLVDQIQFSIVNAWAVQEGLEFNMPTDGALMRDAGILEYLQLSSITPQAWSPFQYGDWEGVFIDNPAFETLNDTLQELADKYGVTKTTIAAAWILRHPARFQLIAGTTRLSRLEEIARATEIRLSREDWYRLYLDAGHRLP